MPQDLFAPFCALRPHAVAAPEIIAPPYDVLSSDEARALVADRPNSFLRISRAEVDFPPGTDPYTEAVYARGAENFRGLQDSGMLIRDSEPSFYLYRLNMNGREQTGIALTASVAAYEQNRVRKHERTRPNKETDRVCNIASLNAQTGPVLCAYRSTPNIAELVHKNSQHEALFEVAGPNGVVHSVWRLNSTESVAMLNRALNELQALYIADGHHRAAAAARVAQERRQTSGPSVPMAAYEFFLAVAFPHDQLTILDYNRVVADLNGLSSADFLSAIAQRFDVQPCAGAFKPDMAHHFGMYFDGCWYQLLLHERLRTDDPVEGLDVSLLQQHLIEPVLDISDPRTDPRIDFVGGIRGLKELSSRVNSGQAAVGFALYPTTMEQLMSVADAERLMPPKSTWFEPKLADGLLSHVLD